MLVNDNILSQYWAKLEMYLRKMSYLSISPFPVTLLFFFLRLYSLSMHSTQKTVKVAVHPNEVAMRYMYISRDSRYRGIPCWPRNTAFLSLWGKGIL